MLNFKSKIGNKGFTLVEMLIILLIIGVVVAVLVGIMGNPAATATVDGTVAKMGDDMRSIKDAMDLYTTKGNTPTVDDATFAFSDLMAKGIATQMPVPSSNAGTGTAYTLDKATYTAWGSGTADIAIVLTGVKDTICIAFNKKFAGSTDTTVPPAFVGTIGAQCFGPGGDANTTVWPAVVN